ncbi:hypothetical protein P154DRAFT_198675 [Amniculicola lignicola CBS 123094]|uniref:Uncharacterized protein n=1 Tax=Amniculicola lignicola CBS 123094 TaxID=1392246 RepID=A0A6A5WI34_9PLEO|nr:hypothetical protein P154DRAFT_198675 [Amniculicola lignicola CBS 123094]
MWQNRYRLHSSPCSVASLTSPRNVWSMALRHCHRADDLVLFLDARVEADREAEKNADQSVGWVSPSLGRTTDPHENCSMKTGGKNRLEMAFWRAVNVAFLAFSVMFSGWQLAAIARGSGAEGHRYLGLRKW